MRGRLAKGILRLSAGLPLPLLQLLGRVLGLAGDLVPNQLRSATRDNLALCFPALTERERRRLGRRALVETGKGVMEVGPLLLRDMRRVERLVRARHGLEHLRAALARGKGAIVVAPHLGNWEVVGTDLPRYAPTTSMYRPLREPALEPLVRAARERSGARLVRTDAGGVKQLYAALARGEIVGILPDQRPKSATAGVLAPFFGVPAPTGTLIPRLLRRSGATAVFVVALRLPRGGGFEIRCLPAPPGIDDPDPVVACTALNRGVEACIRLAPEQYLWGYRRFEGEAYAELHRAAASG